MVAVVAFSVINIIEYLDTFSIKDLDWRFDEGKIMNKYGLRNKVTFAIKI